MAIKNMTNSSAAPAPAAPTPAPASGAKVPQAPQGNTDSAKDRAKKAFLSDGAAERNQLTEEQRAAEGTKSDKIAFICSLCNPTVATVRKSGGLNIPSNDVVGVQIKVMEDTEITRYPYLPTARTPMDIDFDAAFTEKAAAGSVVLLNLMEAAALASRVEYASVWSGEGVTVRLGSKYSNSRPYPRPAFTTSSGSVKENMIAIADMVPNPAGGKPIPKVKQGFEAFEVLLRRDDKDSTKPNKPKDETAAVNAAAWRAYFAKHGNRG